MQICDLIKTREDEILLASILKKPSEFLIAYPETKISKSQLARFRKLQAQLKRGVPLAYLRGYQWFFGRMFYVDKSVLIPRPETELLIEKALAANPGKFKKIIDVGTGSGIIAITLALETTRPEVIAIDISEKALKVAKENAKKLHTKVVFKKGNLLSPLGKELKDAKNILIAANLPYISKKELKEPSIKFEPKLALYGGTDHFSIIQKLLVQIKELRIRSSLVLLEVNYDQASRIKKEVKKLWPDAKLEIKKDLNGYYRLAVLALP